MYATVINRNVKQDNNCENNKFSLCMYAHCTCTCVQYLVTSSDGGRKINTAFFVEGLFKNAFSASYFVSLEIQNNMVRTITIRKGIMYNLMNKISEAMI